MIDLAKSTLDELQAEFVRLATVVSVAENDRQQILAEMEGRKRIASAKVKVDAMTDDEKAALREVLQVDAAALAVAPVAEPAP